MKDDTNNMFLVLAALALAFVLLTSKPRATSAVPADPGAVQPGPGSGIDDASIGSVAGAVVCSVAGAPAAASLCAAAGGILVPKVKGAVTSLFNPGTDKGVSAWAREELARQRAAELEKLKAACVAKGGRPTTMNGYYSGCNLSGPSIVSPGGGRVTWLNPTADNPSGVPKVEHCEAIAGRVECWDPTAPAYMPGGSK